MATYYIAPTGNDTTGTGAVGTPWATFSKAVTASAAGDTIIAAAGTYAAFATFSTLRTIIGATPVNNLPTTIVDFSAGNPNYTGRGTVTNITFQNITNGSANSGNFSAGNSVDLTFSACCFRNNTFNSSYAGTFWGAGGASGTGILTVSGCLFYGYTNTGPSNFNGYFSGGDSAIPNLRVNNCTFYSSAAVSTQIIGRTNPGVAITAIFKNNIFYAATAGNFVGLLGGVAINVAGSAKNWAYNYTSNAVTGSLDFIGTTDPLFVDGPGANFNLRPTSPCLDVGSL